MADNPDRSVHAEMRTLDGDMLWVAYYRTQGRWDSETAGVEGVIMTARRTVAPSRKPISLSQAVGLTLMAHKSEQGEWFPGRPGGRTLDARVRKALDTTKKGKR